MAIMVGNHPPLGAGSSLCSERRSAMISFRASRASSNMSSSGASSNGADSASDIHAQITSCASRSCFRVHRGEIGVDYVRWWLNGHRDV